MSSKKLKSDAYGTPESYFPYLVKTAPFTDEDRKRHAELTPQQRIEWLLMMQNLLLIQFKDKQSGR